MQLYEQYLRLSPDSIIPQTVEGNLPLSLDASDIGDAYLDSMYRLPLTWRWRMPEMQPVRILNKSLNNGMKFDSFASLDSFAAVTDQATTSPVYVSPATTGNTFNDALSGLVRGLTPAANAAIQNALGIRQPAPTVQPQYLQPAAPAPKSNTTMYLVIGGVVVAVLVVAMVMMKKK
jgi:hypothetical protein